MRIDSYAQVQQLYGNKKTQKVKKTSQTVFQDQLQISSMGKDIQIAKSAVYSAPDVREDVVASLKKTIRSGNYEVTGEQFAQKIIEKYQSSFVGSF